MKQLELGAVAQKTDDKKTADITTSERLMRTDTIPASWKSVLEAEFAKPYFAELSRYVDAERKSATVFPPEEEVFAALEATPYDKVKVLILGQDPYHGPGQGHGLCFSVKPGVAVPPSLVNMYKELETDLGIARSKSGYLMSWAQQGVLLLNAVLTVRQAEPNSHKDRGWEQFTDAVIKAVSAKSDHVVFVLWGAYAKKKAKLIDAKKHTVLQGAHPSPLSASAGFFGSKPFSKINDDLEKNGRGKIDWSVKG